MACLSVSACEFLNPKEPEPEIVELPLPRFVADSLFTVTDSGLKFFDFEIGESDSVVVGDTLILHYNAWLSDSLLVDSSFLRGFPLIFIVGRGEVIPGWEQGLIGMRAVGDRQLIVPPDLAYGPTGNGVVPPESTIIFEINLLSK